MQVDDETYTFSSVQECMNQTAMHFDKDAEPRQYNVQLCSHYDDRLSDLRSLLNCVDTLEECTNDHMQKCIVNNNLDPGDRTLIPWKLRNKMCL